MFVKSQGMWNLAKVFIEFGKQIFFLGFHPLVGFCLWVKIDFSSFFRVLTFPQVYVSEFGKQRLEEERTKGPKELLSTIEAKKDEEDEG